VEQKGFSLEAVPEDLEIPEICIAAVKCDRRVFYQYLLDRFKTS
jgi:hypothetical protein